MTDELPSRRRFQFRLRTLLIVVTLLAVACWVVVDRQRLIRERDEAQERAAAARGEADKATMAVEYLAQHQKDEPKAGPAREKP